MTVSTGKYYTQMNASSFRTFLNDRLMLGDHLTQVTTGLGSTVYLIECKGCAVQYIGETENAFDVD